MTYTETDAIAAIARAIQTEQNYVFVAGLAGAFFAEPDDAEPSINSPSTVRACRPTPRWWIQPRCLPRRRGSRPRHRSRIRRPRARRLQRSVTRSWASTPMSRR